MDTIELWDWKRIFIGEAPPEFLIEVLIRTIAAYFLLLLAVRLLGKRMTTQASITELAVMITLGAIVSPVMQLPDRGLLFAVVVLAVICGLHWLATRWSGNNERIENFIQGKLSILVSDGIMHVQEMHRAGISHEELFAQLRKESIENLSEVSRVYLEACGLFSIYKNDHPGPGLLTFPEGDSVIVKEMTMLRDGSRACSECGHVQHITRSDEKCAVCHKAHWANVYQRKSPAI